MNYINIANLKFKSDIFKSSNPFFMIFFIIFLKYFLLYIKVSKNVSASYDQENKERLPKKKEKRKTS